jgi:hypothetical protein
MNMPSPRRFPPPWTIKELNDACFVVSDANGLKLAHVYFEEEPGRRAAANLLTKDEHEGLRQMSPSYRSSWELQ